MLAVGVPTTASKQISSSTTLDTADVGCWKALSSSTRVVWFKRGWPFVHPAHTHITVRLAEILNTHQRRPTSWPCHCCVNHNTQASITRRVVVARGRRWHLSRRASSPSGHRPLCQEGFLLSAARCSRRPHPPLCWRERAAALCLGRRSGQAPARPGEGLPTLQARRSPAACTSSAAAFPLGPTVLATGSTKCSRCVVFLSLTLHALESRFAPSLVFPLPSAY